MTQTELKRLIISLQSTPNILQLFFTLMCGSFKLSQASLPIQVMLMHFLYIKQKNMCSWAKRLVPSE